MPLNIGEKYRKVESTNLIYRLLTGLNFIASGNNVFKIFWGAGNLRMSYD